MSAARPLRVVDAETPPDPMTALRSALAAGQLNPAQAAALDALLGTLIAPTETPSTTSTPTGHLDNEQLIERYLRAKRTQWRPQTLRVREMQLHRIGRQLAPTLLADATEEDLIAWSEALTGKPETIASYTSSAKGLYRWMAVKARPRIRIDDPALILDRPRIPEAPPRPIHSDQYDLALACAVADPEMWAWLGLMGCSGLRCCEIAWLHVGDLERRDNDTSGLLHVTGKGGKQRIVPAGPHLMATLEAFARGRVEGPLFRRMSDGAEHNPNAVSGRVSRFFRQLRIPATAHQLRHRWATDYHALDPDLYRQAKLMGHASVDTTQRYTEVDPVEAVEHIRVLTRRRLNASGQPKLGVR